MNHISLDTFMKKANFFPVIDGSFTQAQKSGMASMIIPIWFLKRLQDTYRDLLFLNTFDMKQGLQVPRVMSVVMFLCLFTLLILGNFVVP